MSESEVEKNVYKLSVSEGVFIQSLSSQEFIVCIVDRVTSCLPVMI